MEKVVNTTPSKNNTFHCDYHFTTFGRLLFTILLVSQCGQISLDASHVLASQYPRNRKLEANVRKVQDIWDTVQKNNPDFQEEDPHLQKLHLREIMEIMTRGHPRRKPWPTYISGLRNQSRLSSEFSASTPQPT